MGDSAHTTHHTNPRKKSAHRLFLEDKNIFQKIGSRITNRNRNRISTTRADLLKNVLIFEKKGSADAF
jgi:hypothetical protein